MWPIALWLTIALMIFSTQMTTGYKPIFVMHGLNADDHSTDFMVHRIQKAHPETVVFQTNSYPNSSGHTPLWEQLKGDLGAEFRNFSRTYPGGFHMIGVSQGGLVCRSLVELYPDHNVASLIAIASPLAGTYGDQENVPFSGARVSESIAYKLMYQPSIQAQFSQANLFKDPKHYDLYLKYNVFLPYIENEIQTNMSESFKRGFTRVNKIVMIGGPDDGNLIPWQSSHFSFVNANDEIVFFKDRRAYKEDWFGLRTMDEQKKLTICILSGLQHTSFSRTGYVVDECVIPYLD